MSANGLGDGADHGSGRGEEDRRMQFKNAGKTKDELRRRRIDENLELRKAKREDTMMKRRNVDLDNLLSSPESPQHEVQEKHVHIDPREEVAICAEGLKGGTDTKVFNNLQRLRKILSRETHPPIDLVIGAGLLSRIVQLLAHPEEKMQFEAAWAITNVASGTSAHTQAVIDSGAVPILLSLVATSSSTEVAEQALWGLGNIVGDGPSNRDAILNAGIVPIILGHLQKPNLPRSFGKNIAWMISNLTRGKNPPPNFEVVKAFLPALSHLLDSKDMDTVVDSAWSLSYMSDGTEENIDCVIGAGVVPKVVRILQSTRDARALTPCVRIIGNIVTGSDAQTDVVVGAGALDAIVPILQLPKNGLVKETCWLISNIAAGNKNQIQAVMDSGCLNQIVAIMRHGEYKCQKEAAWIITNMLAGGNPDQLKEICAFEILPPLCDLLRSQDPKFVIILLDALYGLLNSAKRYGFVELVTAAVEECGGLDILERIQNHDNEEIYQKTYNIIENFFQDADGSGDQVEEEEAGENMQFNF